MPGVAVDAELVPAAGAAGLMSVAVVVLDGVVATEVAIALVVAVAVAVVLVEAEAEGVLVVALAAAQQPWQTHC